MNEFINRINIQREVLKIVNQNTSLKEDLFGLSKKAIDRWANTNGFKVDSVKCNLLYSISGKLFFLATKSQEQITSEYKILSNEVSQLRENLKNAFN